MQVQKFKVGDKVLVEAKIIGEGKGTGEYRVGPVMNACAFWVVKDAIHPFTAKDTNVPTKTYEDGLAEAWEAARRIMLFEKDGGLSLAEAIGIFGVDNFPEIFKNFTAAEAAAKITEWEKKKEIRIGDIVNADGNMGAVVNVGRDWVRILTGEGITISCSPDIITKTGRAIDIAGLLKQIGGTDDV